ncbi:mannose-6-phosphate isomerase [Desulfovibrio ferrophilus]|uniref:Mannose-6-phosphate isomerase n=2 Tax=Desulfovibrio ferrophilus TaxID=241368 RepID=A0A2Z6AV11_9BACT|nr:mannose-6-phosphate isomerase [Desulfovibrio ferrophilus]
MVGFVAARLFKPSSLRHGQAMKTRYDDISPYITKDGSIIRELMHPSQHPVCGQSLAEAIVPPHATTMAHVHHRTEELYHVTAGRGRMVLGAESFDVSQGDTVLIAPGTEHHIRNTGKQDLRVLCCCSPAYTHDDTELCGPKDQEQAVDR